MQNLPISLQKTKFQELKKRPLQQRQGSFSIYIENGIAKLSHFFIQNEPSYGIGLVFGGEGDDF